MVDLSIRRKNRREGEKIRSKSLFILGFCFVIVGSGIALLSPAALNTPICDPFYRVDELDSFSNSGWRGDYFETINSPAMSTSEAGGDLFGNQIMWYDFYGFQGVNGRVELTSSSIPAAGSCNVTVGFRKSGIFVDIVNSTVRFGADGVPLGSTNYQLPDISGCDIWRIVFADTLHNSVEITIRVYFYGTGGIALIPLSLVASGLILFAIAGYISRKNAGLRGKAEKIYTLGIGGGLTIFLILGVVLQSIGIGFMALLSILITEAIAAVIGFLLYFKFKASSKGPTGDIALNSKAMPPRAFTPIELKKICTACGAEINSHQKFCDKCGSKQ